MNEREKIKGKQPIKANPKAQNLNIHKLTSMKYSDSKIIKNDSQRSGEKQNYLHEGLNVLQKALKFITTCKIKYSKLDLLVRSLKQYSSLLSNQQRNSQSLNSKEKQMQKNKVNKISIQNLKKQKAFLLNHIEKKKAQRKIFLPQIAKNSTNSIHKSYLNQEVSNRLQRSTMKHQKNQNKSLSKDKKIFSTLSPKRRLLTTIDTKEQSKNEMMKNQKIQFNKLKKGQFEESMSMYRSMMRGKQNTKYSNLDDMEIIKSVKQRIQRHLQIVDKLQTKILQLQMKLKLSQSQVKKRHELPKQEIVEGNASNTQFKNTIQNLAMIKNPQNSLKDHQIQTLRQQLRQRQAQIRNLYIVMESRNLQVSHFSRQQ